jgi:hypothetical protein
MGKLIKNKKAKPRKTIVKIIAISFLLLDISNINAAKYAIIVNSDSNITSDPQQIGKGFLKQTSIENANGDTITPFESSDKKAKKAFYKFTLDKSLDDINSYWYKQTFSAGANPPKTISAANTGLNPNYLILIKINSTKNSIGYIKYSYYINADRKDKSKSKALYIFNYPQTGQISNLETEQKAPEEKTKFSFFGLGVKEKPKKQEKIVPQKPQSTTKAKKQAKPAQQQVQTEQKYDLALQDKSVQEAQAQAKQQAQAAKQAQLEVQQAQAKAQKAKAKALEIEAQAEKKAKLAQQRAQKAMAKAQARIAEVNAKLKAKARAVALAKAKKQAAEARAQARARAQAIAKAQQEAAAAQQQAELAQAKAQAIEAKARAQEAAAEHKARVAEAMLEATPDQATTTNDQQSKKSSYNPGPVITVVKRPSRQSTNAQPPSTANQTDIDSQIEQATQNIQGLND